MCVCLNYRLWSKSVPTINSWSVSFGMHGWDWCVGINCISEQELSMSLQCNYNRVFRARSR